MKDQIRAVIERAQEVGGGERGIEKQRQPGLVCDLGDCGDVQHVETGVAEGLAEHEPCLGPDGGAKRARVPGVDERCLDPEARQRVGQQVVRATVERGRRDNVLAGADDGHDRKVHRGLPAGGGDRSHSALQRRDSLLENGGGRIGDARVHVTWALGVEQRCRVIRVAEDERCRLVDRRRAGAGRRIGLLPRVQAQGVEVDVSGSAHGWSRRERAGGGAEWRRPRGRCRVRHRPSWEVSCVSSCRADCTTVGDEVIGTMAQRVNRAATDQSRRGCGADAFRRSAARP